MAPGEESLETRLFPLRHIPWDELAFETVRAALAHHLRHPRHGVLVKTLGQRPAPFLRLSAGEETAVRGASASAPSAGGSPTSRTSPTA